jgi:hypothetical protein
MVSSARRLYASTGWGEEVDTREVESYPKELGALFDL